MLKNISRLELTVEKKRYEFICDSDAPLSDVKEALFQFQKFVGKIEDATKEQQAQQAPIESKESEEVVIQKEETPQG